MAKKKIGTIDCTPSWAFTMEVCIMALENGTGEGKAAAREQLRGLGRQLDAVQGSQHRIRATINSGE